MRLLASLITQHDHRIKNDLYTRDKVAFIFLSLLEIEKTIDETVLAWEKREYWVKSDAFREEWAWVKDLRGRMFKKINMQNWQLLELEIEILEEKLSSTEPLKRIDHPDFWKGAYQTLSKRLLRK